MSDEAGKIVKREMHANSLDAWGMLDDLKTRKIDVLNAYSECGELTDREVMVRLRHRDPNAVRPRITELVKAGLLIECGKRKDVVSGRKVRVCRLAVVPEQMELVILKRRRNGGNNREKGARYETSNL